VSPDEVTIQGETVALVSDILASSGQDIDAIGARLADARNSVIGLSEKSIADSQEVTILVDRTVPFKVVKKVMSTCTSQGYGRISLAVLQKAPDAHVAKN
jgi:biopolymer transport protein ExbD